ncbi:MAG: lipopolysaccharide export system permease protein [Pseudomonadota bacterium]|nr:lipopolysaccharide export system permease protein [Pseudomonadota bacterium]
MLVKKVFYRELVSNASKIFIVLVFILPITELFKLLDQAASGNIPTITLLTMMIYGTIASFPMILTIACFLTVVITINRFCKDHEFAIWLSSGLSPFYWLRQVAIFSLPMSIICAISSMYITPWATSKSQNYVEFLSKQQTNMIISPGIFKEDGGIIFYLEHYSLNPGIAKKIFLQYTDNNESPVTYNVTAQAGRIDNDNGIFGVTLINGNRYDLMSARDTRIVLHFDQFRASVKQQYTPLEKARMEMPTSTVRQLLSDPSTHAQSELSWRLSIAIMMFVMCFLAVPISIQTGRVQNSLIFVLPPIIYAVYENFILSLNGYIKDGKISIIAVFFVHILMLLFAVLLTYVKTFPKGYLFSKNKQ